MKKAIVNTPQGRVSITAPADKEMAVDNGLLQHGILAIGEYGASGVKVAVFKDWCSVSYDPDGYIFNGKP